MQIACSEKGHVTHDRVYDYYHNTQKQGSL